MSTKWESVNVECPFYRENDDLTIRCEGLTHGETVTRRFPRKTARAACMEQVCCGAYRNCPVYRLVSEVKYNYREWE